MKRFWIATFDSRHFAFEAYGETQEAARAAMLATIDAHLVNVGADADDHPFVDDVREGMEVRERLMGGGWRDDYQLTGDRPSADGAA